MTLVLYVYIYIYICKGKGEGKGKVHPRTGHDGPEGEKMYSATLSLNSALDGVGVQRHTSAALPPAKRPSTHFTEGWVVPRAGPDGCGKSLPPPAFDPQTVQLVASRHSDHAIPAKLLYLSVILAVDKLNAQIILVILDHSLVSL